MSSRPQLFRITPEDRKSKAVREVDFAQLGLRERQDIQEWIAANPRILDPDLLLIGKEFSGFDRTSERLDLLAVDSDGRLVVIELKRDDTGADAHWQAIKYASYFQRANPDNIYRITCLPRKIGRNGGPAAASEASQLGRFECVEQRSTNYHCESSVCTRSYVCRHLVEREDAGRQRHNVHSTDALPGYGHRFAVRAGQHDYSSARCR